MKSCRGLRIDMDFMNLNQSAHGDREFGYIGARMRLQRKVIVGYWKDKNIHSEIGTWTRAACAWHDAQHLKISRFGDNMRNVAVTEGDKVEAQIRLRYTVNGYGIGDLTRSVSDVSDAETDKLTREYDDAYVVAETLRPAGRQRQSLREAARIELGLRRFLVRKRFVRVHGYVRRSSRPCAIARHRGAALDGRRLWLWGRR